VIALACFGGAGYLIYRGRSKGAAAGDAPATPAPAAAAESPAQDAGSLLTGGDEAPKE
jgi:hypothetical protein